MSRDKVARLINRIPLRFIRGASLVFAFSPIAFALLYAPLILLLFITLPIGVISAIMAISGTSSGYR